MSRDVRIYALLARSSSKAVIFRRGPSKQVLLLRWDTETDEIEEGQWLKARIYERRCDLSPDGDLLLYFAATYRPPYGSWSAISKPPYFTALALWPKGDGWGGGGHFKTRNEIALNHRPTEMDLAEGFQLPKRFSVHLFGDWPGRGEDDPIWSVRLERDGWNQLQPGKIVKKDHGADVWIELDPAILWQKRHPVSPDRYRLEMAIRGIKERNGPWYLTEHAVLSSSGETWNLGRSDWADWSHSGDLLFTKGPSLFRIPYVDGVLAPFAEAREITNLESATFTQRPPREKDRRWRD